MPILSILKVNKIKEFKKGDKLIIPKQTDLQPQVRTDVSIPRTTIEVIEATNNFYKFKIRQEGDTKRKPIKLLWEKFEEIIDYEKGWQEIFYFEGRYDKPNSELILFCDDSNTKTLLERLDKSDIDADTTEFDLVKLRRTKSFRIWGIWGKVNSVHIAKKGIFGYDLGEEKEIKDEDITALDVNFKIDGEDISMVISKNGRIFSHNKIPINKLYEFYLGIRDGAY
jgi:hypothetical protein